MNRSKSLSLILEGKDNWFIPSRKELENEFNEEPSIINYMEIATKNRGMSTKEREQLKNSFLKAIKQADIITLKGKDILKIKDIPATSKSSLKDVEVIVKRYAGPKDWENIVSRIESGSPMPMPIVNKKGNEYWALGGRTRLSAAAILDKPVKILVLDDKKILPMFEIERVKASDSFLLLIPDEKKTYVKEYVKYLLGKGEKPDPTGVGSDELKMYHNLADDMVRTIKGDRR